VPIGLPVAVSRVTSVRSSFAMPKSSTLTVPSAAIRTLSGFKSRCTTGIAWAYDSTVQICAAIDAAQLTGSSAFSPALARTVRRDVPRTYSITRYSRSYDASSSTASKTCGTPWCPIRAVTRASRWKRRANSCACASEATASDRMSLTAISRSSTVS
jgi:hypothetical protein